MDTILETKSNSFSRRLYLKEGKLLKQMLMERFMEVSVKFLFFNSGVIEVHFDPSYLGKHWFEMGINNVEV